MIEALFKFAQPHAYPHKSSFPSCAVFTYGVLFGIINAMVIFGVSSVLKSVD